MFGPACCPAGSGGIELARVTGQADGSDVVGESDRAAELHQGDIIVKDGFIVLRMNDDLGHRVLHLVLVRVILTLSSKVNDPCTRDAS